MPTLRRLGELPLLVGPAGAGRTLRQVGPPVRELASGEELTLGALTIRATRAVHDGRRSPVSPPVESLGFLIEGRLRVYFAGDTELFDGMAELAPIDVALLPVAGWGPSLGSRPHGRRAGRARRRAAASGVSPSRSTGARTPRSGSGATATGCFATRRSRSPSTSRGSRPARAWRSSNPEDLSRSPSGGEGRRHDNHPSRVMPA